ncbi:MAG: signal peptide peptidase SppA [Bacteroidales bacterium]|nr:signal peptide peptidase SppA [Bacteroidales bacterium]MBR5862697.1 signal peptide peptidase SppA [Bacteroidales bacterium]
MKDFIKMTLATITGLFLFGFVATFLFVGMIGAIAAAGETTPIMPKEAVLQIDFTNLMLTEQTSEADPLAMLQSGTEITPVGIYSAINAINAAAQDPAIRYIYMKPDGVSGGQAQIEEFRTALKNFRDSGKAIVSYIENPTNAGYYLASVSDKVYMTRHDGGMNMFFGMASQQIFLKDALEKLGVNVQLIRHGKYKSAGEMFVRNSSSKENLEQNEAMVNSMWESWSTQIAQSRDLTADELNAMLNNLELNFPSDFLEKGLVDELLSREELQQKLADLYVTDNYKNVKNISLADYAKIKDVPDVKAASKIAVIYAEGNIVDGNEKEGVAGDRFAKIIADVRADKDVKAVVLRVNSPGGSVMASEKIKAELDLLREKVPVIASYGDYAASGGYWISANCDYIFANATTLTGSIGVFSMIPDFGGTIKNKLHVTVTPVKSNDHADMLSMIRALTPKEEAYMQASVERIYTKFTSIVAEGRDMTVEDVDAIAQGRVWTGAEALEIGLVDQIGTLEDAIEYAAMSIEGVTSVSDVQIAAYPKPLTTLEMLLESLGGQSAFAGTPLESIEQAFRGWDASQAGKVYARIPYEIIVR